MLTGLEPHTSGLIRVMGRDRFAESRETPKDDRVIGLCPQYSILYPDLSAREHLVFYARLKAGGRDREEMEQEVTE